MGSSILFREPVLSDSPIQTTGSPAFYTSSRNDFNHAGGYNYSNEGICNHNFRSIIMIIIIILDKLHT